VKEIFQVVILHQHHGRVSYLRRGLHLTIIAINEHIKVGQTCHHHSGTKRIGSCCLRSCHNQQARRSYSSHLSKLCVSVMGTSHDRTSDILMIDFEEHMLCLLEIYKH